MKKNYYTFTKSKKSLAHFILDSCVKPFFCSVEKVPRCGTCFTPIYVLGFVTEYDINLSPVLNPLSNSSMVCQLQIILH